MAVVSCPPRVVLKMLGSGSNTCGFPQKDIGTELAKLLRPNNAGK